MADAFQLDPRLAGDSHLLARWPLCQLRLMDDARYPWLLLVPAIAAAREAIDLDEATRRQLWRETDAAAMVMRAAFAPDKLNIGALGNVVEQLHVHVVARQQGDDAWPGPVWGAHPRLARTAAERDAVSKRIHDILPLFAFEEAP